MKPGVTRQATDKLFWNLYKGKPIDPTSHGIVQPLADLWLYDYDNGQFVPGRLVTVRWFSLIAIMVVLIACINYMNLGTARSAKRAKEVGIRKVAGAGRGLLDQGSFWVNRCLPLWWPVHWPLAWRRFACQRLTTCSTGILYCLTQILCFGFPLQVLWYLPAQSSQAAIQRFICRLTGLQRC